MRIETAEDERQFRELVSASSGPVSRPRTQDYEKAQYSWPDFLQPRIEVHLGDLERAGRDAKPVMESRHTLKLFRGIVGSKPVAELTTDDCRKFFDEVVYWPKHATKRPEFKDMDVRAVLEKANTLTEPKPAAASLNKHHQRLSAFFNWPKKNKAISDNPLLGLARQDKDTQEEMGRAFTQTELNAIFEPAAYTNWAKVLPHRFWVPMLALYSDEGAHNTAVCRQALRGKEAGPAAWRALLADAAACEDRVRTFKRVVAGHERNLAAIASDEPPLLSRKSRQEQALTDALEGLGDLGPIYVQQLLAAATKAERKWLTAAVRSAEDDGTSLEAAETRESTVQPRLLPLDAQPSRPSL